MTRWWSLQEPMLQSSLAKTVNRFQLASNTRSMMKTLPRRASIRHELISHLATDLPLRFASEWLFTSKATISRYKQSNSTHLYLTLAYPFNVKRMKVDFSEQEEIEEFIRDACPTKSGSPNERNYLWTTKEALYRHYVQTHDCPRGYDVFMRYFHKLKVNVRASYWGSFDCPRCAEFREEERKREAGIGSVSNLMEAQLHRELIRIQIQEYKDQKASIKDHELLIIMDFTKIYLDTEKESIVEVLVLVTMRRVGEAIETQYYDFMCNNKETRQNDFFFVRNVLDDLLLYRKYGDVRGRRSKVIFWTDGGPHHFKTNFHLWFLSEMAANLGIVIEHHYFPAYHGHSLADGHAGTLKSAFRRFKVEIEGKRLKDFPLLQGPVNCHQLKEQLLTKVKNTQIIVYDTIPRDEKLKPTLKNAQKLDHIKQAHCLRFKAVGGGVAFRTSSKAAESMGTVF